MLKTKTFFAHPITKPSASTQEFKNFDSILQKLSVIPNKNGKSAPTQLAPPMPGQAHGTRMLSNLQRIQTSLKHNVDNPDIIY